MSEVVVVIGPGSIGQAIARRVSAGKHVVLADLRLANADAATDAMRNAGFDVSTTTVDVSSRDSVAGQPRAGGQEAVDAGHAGSVGQLLAHGVVVAGPGTPAWPAWRSTPSPPLTR